MDNGTQCTIEAQGGPISIEILFKGLTLKCIARMSKFKCGLPR